jgi:hypothetical protein
VFRSVLVEVAQVGRSGDVGRHGTPQRGGITSAYGEQADRWKDAQAGPTLPTLRTWIACGSGRGTGTGGGIRGPCWPSLSS